MPCIWPECLALTPDHYITESNAHGHICLDVINRADAEVYIVQNLPETDYFQTDPNVAKYNL